LRTYWKSERLRGEEASEMKAAIVYGVGDIRIEEVPAPECDDASVIVKIYKASICNGSDGAVFKEERILKKAYPHLAFPLIGGHESSGEIVEVGKAATGWKVGDRVTYWCQCTGAFAEYCKINPDRLSMIKISDNISYSVGSFMEMLGSTMKYGAEVELGQIVAVFGLGPAGQLLVQEARISGAVEVIGIDLYPFRLQKARELGATLTINAGKEDVIETVRKKVGKVDICIDATGADIVDLVVQIFPRRYLMYGCTDKGIAFNAVTQAFYQSNFPELRWRHRPEVTCLMEQGERLISRGVLKLEPLITHHIPLEEVVEGIKMTFQQKDKCIKIVVDITDKEF
jgi:2-desacetyl-2-hydroxyethyl bacteriochlorophyllide A dehydrogenase